MLMKVVSKSMIFATIIAVAFASISAAGAFAASGTGSSGTRQANITVSPNEVRDVKADSTFLTDLQKHPVKLLTKASDRSQEQRWLQKYQVALAEAQAILAGHFNFAAVAANKGTSSTGASGTASSATASHTLAVGKYYQRNPDKLLALYLHMMRELRLKLGLSG